MSNLFNISYVEIPDYFINEIRLKKINKYLAKRRQRVLDKVIEKAMEGNEFLEEEEEFKL